MRSETLAGILLIVGAVTFWVGALTPPWKQWMGPPTLEYLEIIGKSPRGWLAINGCFVVGCLLHLAGMAVWWQRLREGGGHFADLALVGFTVGSVLWLSNLSFRLMATSSAAAERLSTGAAPSWFEPLHRMTGLMFAIYMVLAYLSIAAVGAALNKSGALPGWAAKTAIIFGLVAVPGLATPLFQPPLMVHVVPFILGIQLLRGR